MKERNHLSYCNPENLALHIEAVNLADGDYKLVPVDSLAQEVNLNCTNSAQDLGQVPEVPLPDSAQEGKAPLHNPIIFRIIIHLAIDIVL